MTTARGLDDNAMDAAFFAKRGPDPRRQGKTRPIHPVRLPGTGRLRRSTIRHRPHARPGRRAVAVRIPIGTETAAGAALELYGREIPVQLV